MKKFCDYRNPDLALLIIRVVVALIFISHGVSKLGNPQADMFFSSVGLPGWLALIVGIVETLAGIAVLLGVATTSASYALAVIMLGAIFFVKLENGFGSMEIDIALLSSALAIAWIGPGKYSLSKK